MQSSVVGLVVEFSPATRETRVRFPDYAIFLLPLYLFCHSRASANTGAIAPHGPRAEDEHAQFCGGRSHRRLGDGRLLTVVTGAGAMLELTKSTWLQLETPVDETLAAWNPGLYRNGRVAGSRPAPPSSATEGFLTS